MRKDPTEFRARFLRWKSGEKVYEAGLPHYEGGKDARKLEYHPEEDYYYGGNLFGKGNELVVKGKASPKLYMHPWKTERDLRQEQNEYYYSLPLQEGWKKDLSKPLSPVDPVGEFVVGNAVLNPAFKYVFGGFGNVIKDAAYNTAGKIKPLRNALIAKEINNTVESAKSFGDDFMSYQPIDIPSADFIDTFRKLGFSGLSKNSPMQYLFQKHFGTSPADYVSHWISLLSKTNMPKHRQLKFLLDMFDHLLDVLQKERTGLIGDITRVKDGTSYNDAVLERGANMMIDLFDSPQYAERWYGSKGFQQIQQDLINNIKTVRPILLDNALVSDVGFLPTEIIGAGGVYLPKKHMIQVLRKNNDLIGTVTHEFSHASDKGLGVFDAIYNKLVPKAKPGTNKFDYYDDWSEKRARVMSILADMRKRNYNINSYNDILDYLLFNNAYGNSSAASLFDNYKISIPDLLDVIRYAKTASVPIVGGSLIYPTVNRKK